MENINNTVNKETPIESFTNPTSPVQKQSNNYKALFFLFLFISLSLGIFYYLSLAKNFPISIINEQGSNQSQDTKNTSTTTWQKPVSTGKIIPIVKDQKLYIYSLADKKLQPTDYKTGWGNGSANFGEDNPLVSPDGKLIVFINTEDNNSLYLISDPNQKALKITNYPVEYLNSWSSDSSKILFYTDVDNLVSRKGGSEMGGGPYPTWELSETFIKNFVPGFHSFNVNNGLDTYIPQLLGADQFIDSNRIIIAELTQPENNQKRFVLFNVDTFVADYTTVNYPEKSFSLQKSFSADGKYWVINKDDGNTESGSKMIYAIFPSQEGDLIDSAPWAFIQGPVLSPNSQYVAYQKRGEQIKPGLYAEKTIIWDTSSKKAIKELDGMPRYWVDENTILISVSNYDNDNPSGYLSFSIFNIDTQEKININ